MKNKLFSKSIAFLAMAAALAACSSNDDNGETPVNPDNQKYTWSTDGGIKACDHLLFDADGKEDANGKVIGNGDQEFVFKGKQTLAKGTYELRGWIYVAEGSELTIPAGTIIKGDKQTKATLIAEPGGKIIAQGTQTEPIVFTSEQPAGSRKPGDWGGIILCGKAPNNNGVLNQQIEGGPRTKHGGTNAEDNSGVLSYVRIEFAGYPFQKDQEINGLTLGSVGSGTKIDHVQVSYSNDDSFEWFGGTVNCDHLIAFRGWDDDFDTDNGFAGNVSYGLSVRDSRIADASQSNGFESDNNASGSTATPYTTANFSYMTLLGPKTFDASFENNKDYINGGSMNPGNGSSTGLFQAAMHIRRNSRLNCTNSVFIGWPIGIILDNQKGDTQGAAAQGLLKLNNLCFAGMTITGSDFNKVYQDNLMTDYTNQTLDTSKPSFSTSFFRIAANNNSISDWTAMAWNGIASIIEANRKVSATAGAFADGNDWTLGWANFDPEHTQY